MRLAFARGAGFIPALAVNEPTDSAAPIPNVLAERYASPAMKGLWSQRGRVALERDFWIAVMKAQRELGVPIPAAAIRDYERVKNRIDLAAIAAQKRVHELQGQQHTWYCGAWTGYGFHEDGLKSGLAAADALLAQTQQARKAAA